MPHIQQLSPHVADLIAAGEVVERQKIGSAVDADRRSSVVRTGPGSGREAQDQKKTK